MIILSAFSASLGDLNIRSEDKTFFVAPSKEHMIGCYSSHVGLMSRWQRVRDGERLEGDLLPMQMSLESEKSLNGIHNQFCFFVVKKGGFMLLRSRSSRAGDFAEC
ncbi:hypothetical protein TNIN_265931 [Trichonephila inaurata madagascariensis]|uniref:Uncharacterized protein n=1 Tax=Trichonephila inaurata madagascariensis TaxID=2747483 RepID=A0A8X7CPS9_9ARAC|nr:hypothetical protein TNIN_265931 [Trichonephila inaurata madagascariensis]